MKIEVLYVPNCPNHALALERLREILSVESFQKQVSEILVRDAVMAQSLKFPGSPTIRINGQDVEPQSEEAVAFGLMCRLYSDILRVGLVSNHLRSPPIHGICTKSSVFSS